jgi:NAD(P)-dependent dehydrogenase (short-subunit alcohol dehydrogenase family)/acyl carrier protein
MAEQGARRIVLTTRKGLPPREQWSDLLRDGGSQAHQIGAIRQIEALGVDVRIVAVDVADEPQMREFLASQRRGGWPPICGVVHAAGVVEPKPLTEILPADIDAGLRPKVTGGWVLDRLFGDASLDFFILFSSASAVISSPGLGIYAAGNAFLDALAHCRRARGQHALAIDWGPWAQVGMAAAYVGDRGPLDLKGMRAISARVGTSLMEKFMLKDTTQVAVLPIDWNRWREVYTNFSRAPVYDDIYRQPLGSMFPGAPDSGVPNSTHSIGHGSIPAPAKGVDVRSLMVLADPAERVLMLEDFLKKEVARVLDASSVDIDPTVPLLVLGLDSLMVIEVRAQISASFGVVVRLMDLLGGATIKDIAATVVSSLFVPGRIESV